MPEDWRLAVELESKRDAEAFREACSGALPPTADSSRVGKSVYVYPDSRDEALRTWEIALELTERHDFGADLRLEQWNPLTREWQAADRPVPADPEPPQPLDIRLRGARWQIRITAASAEQADRLEETLWARGHGTGRIGRRTLALAAETEAAANAVALAAQRFTVDARVDVRPLGLLGRAWIDLRVRGL